jgi:putative phage-type endonuclease
LATESLTNSLDTLGTAVRVGDFENGSTEWHELRKTGIGGSDVAAICRLSPYSSPFKLWATKTGRLDDTFTPSEAAEWGNRLESVVIDKFEEEHPELKVHRHVGTYANQERPWQLANPDAIYETADGKFGIIEVKTSRYEDDWIGDQPPVWYQTQVQWYAQTFGFETPIYVVALFSGSKYREYQVEADRFVQDTYLTEVEKFRELVLADKQPDYDGSTATFETVRALHPDIAPDTDIELGDLGSNYLNALAGYNDASEELNYWKSKVLDLMGDAKRGTLAGEVIVTRQAKAGGVPYLVNKRR